MDIKFILRNNVIFAFFKLLKKQENMNLAVETAEIKPQINNKENKLYTLEEVFDRIDNKFINYYGEYGRKIVNERRTEWNQDKIVNLKML